MKPYRNMLIELIPLDYVLFQCCKWKKSIAHAQLSEHIISYKLETAKNIKNIIYFTIAPSGKHVILYL